MFTINTTWETDKQQDVLNEKLFGHLKSPNSCVVTNERAINLHENENDENIEQIKTLKRKSEISNNHRKKSKKKKNIIVEKDYLDSDRVHVKKHTTKDTDKKFGRNLKTEVDKANLNNYLEVKDSLDEKHKAEKRKKKKEKTKEFKFEKIACSNNADTKMTYHKEENTIEEQRDHNKKKNKKKQLKKEKNMEININEPNKEFVLNNKEKTEISNNTTKKKKKRKFKTNEENTRKENINVVPSGVHNVAYEKSAHSSQVMTSNGPLGGEENTQVCKERTLHTKLHKSKQSSKYSKFQAKLNHKLEGGQFRWINEQLYTSESSDAIVMFQSDPHLFEIYHKGFHSQVDHWPQNPVDVIIDKIKARDSSLIVADFGCGDAKLSKCVPNKVHSFDLIAANEQVTACDMKDVPLRNDSVDIVVFCLSLMGTNLEDFLLEAKRVLKTGGSLLIAEVKSRFEDINTFIENITLLGFSFTYKDESNKMFVMIELGNMEGAPSNTNKDITLKPCIYKRR